MAPAACWSIRLVPLPRRLAWPWAAVWAGASPYVVDDHGDKLFIGAAIGGGWTIQAIQAGNVVVQNGQQKVAIRY